MRKIIIAIDGHSSCGKSTLARDLARALHYAYIDTGAMYRAVTLFFLDRKIDWNDAAAVRHALEGMRIEFREGQTFLNGESVEEAIREMRVSGQVSRVAAIPEVRRALVAQQQRMGREGGVVMDGRDIGSVVFPDAPLKIFLTASTDVRVQRRLSELQAKGKQVSADQVRDNLIERDHIDSTREDSPLIQTPDAHLLDNTDLNREQQLRTALQWAQELINA